MGVTNGLESKRVVILGGSSGIGLAVAEAATTRGAEVIIGSSNAERVQKAIKTVGGDAQGHAVDVSDERAVENFFIKTGAFDHLVYTAADSLQLQDLASTEPPEGQTLLRGTLLVCPRGSQIRESPNTEAWLDRPHDGNRRPTTTKGMGSCRKLVRNDRSSNTCPGD